MWKVSRRVLCLMVVVYLASGVSTVSGQSAGQNEVEKNWASVSIEDQQILKHARQIKQFALGPSTELDCDNILIDCVGAAQSRGSVLSAPISELINQVQNDGTLQPIFIDEVLPPKEEVDGSLDAAYDFETPNLFNLDAYEAGVGTGIAATPPQPETPSVCEDQIPPGGLACEFYVENQICDTLNGLFCTLSCGTCQSQQQDDDVGGEQNCLDIPVPGLSDCDIVKQQGLCTNQNIISQGFCLLTCDACDSVSSLPLLEPLAEDSLPPAPIGEAQEDCVDVPIPGMTDCVSVLQNGLCTNAEVLEKGHCLVTCDACDRFSPTDPLALNILATAPDDESLEPELALPPPTVVATFLSPPPPEFSFPPPPSEFSTALPPPPEFSTALPAPPEFSTSPPPPEYSTALPPPPEFSTSPPPPEFSIPPPPPEFSTSPPPPEFSIPPPPPTDSGVQECVDVPITGMQNCDGVAEIGLCSNADIIGNGFCLVTCDACPSATIDDCVDVPFPGVPDCASILDGGLCTTEGIVSEGFCLKTCGSCGNTSASVSAQPPPPGDVIGTPPAPSDCEDVLVPGIASCDTVRDTGLCSNTEVIGQGFCLLTCDACPTAGVGSVTDCEALDAVECDVEGLQALLPSVPLIDTQPCTALPGITCENGRVTNISIGLTHHTQISGDPGWSIEENQGRQVIPQDLSGQSFPAEVSKLRYLKAFEAEGTGLAGSIPAEISVLTNMVIFDLDGDSMTGTLPPQLSTWTSLLWFDISNQLLTGALPSQYSEWVDVEMMDLSGTSLSGTLPEEWSEMEKLKFLYLYNSGAGSFTGSVPTQWTNFIDSLIQLEFGAQPQLCIGAVQQLQLASFSEDIAALDNC